ncbi:MlaA family lipoprotein [Sphingomonas morindae]|uniref:MlaA family lipoprotein n=1 Tax=Sphingomonas morindae TaxID=1541170 RepID=A0ABY4X553_9SPHN|nr:VacJ family lipoprotein [Sphingomonas morindae]USI72024.1 MlaA family lipoprotein [Sphingomonas morindae]
MRALLCLPLAALLAGCATTGGTPGDPYEKINRKMWGFDQTLDRHVMKPVASGYRAVMPGFLRHGLSNMINNVSEPFSAINALLQAKPKRALNSLGRFVINTTVGFGGFRDVASDNGYKETPEDLGQTFAVWGAKKSTFLVLPFLGPSTIRDGLGSVAAQWVDPYRIVIRKELSFWPSFAVNAFELVDARANLIDSGADSLLESSADSYAVMRSAYLQRRAALIADQDAESAGGDDAALNAALDDLGPDTGGDANAAAPDPSATPPAPTLAPDQPTASQTGSAPKPNEPR